MDRAKPLYESLDRLFIAVNRQRTAHLALVDTTAWQKQAEAELLEAMTQARDVLASDREMR